MPPDGNLFLVPGLADTGVVAGDLLSETLRNALRHRSLPPADMLERAERCHAACAESGSIEDGVEEILFLVSLYPASERLQVLAARLIDQSLGRDAAIPCWFGLLQRFPRCSEAFLITLRWTNRVHGKAAAEAALQAQWRENESDVHHLVTQARGWMDINDPARAENLFRAVTDNFPDFEPGYLFHAAMWRRQGQPWRARQILTEAIEQKPDATRCIALTKLVDRDIDALARLAPTGYAPASHIVLEHLISTAPPVRPSGKVERVLMLTGSLGAGGAERQLVNTATGLVMAHPELDVEICCRSLTDRPAGDFFLPVLQRHGIPVTVHSDHAPFGGDISTSPLAEHVELLRFLPAPMMDATQRLVDYMRTTKPDVVHLWQDGTILSCALAAVLAQVPRIVLSVRTAPPPDRPERDRPEYASLYAALLKRPEVTLSANSRFAARRYAQWLSIDARAVPVVPNGLSALPTQGNADSTERHERFQQSAPGDFTVGTVMRFDANKRPALWIEAAARFLALCPEARFIMVGEGPLLPESRRLAATLGCADRILFVGRTADVGFWLKQMDAFLLLSRWEGLPNVLVEAQLAGVPVITTPAGGAVETLLPGETGFVLTSEEDPSLDEIVARLCGLADDPQLRDRLSVGAMNHGQAGFSVGRMIDMTMEAYLG